MTGWKNIAQSKTIWGAVVAVAATFLQSVGYVITETDTAAIIDLVMQGVAVAGGLYAIYGRVVATKKLHEEPTE